MLKTDPDLDWFFGKAEQQLCTDAAMEVKYERGYPDTTELAKNIAESNMARALFGWK